MIGVSPQEINLDKFLTVEETMLFHAGYYGVPKQKAKERTEEFLERFALTEKRKQGQYAIWWDEAAGALRQGAHARPEGALPRRADGRGGRGAALQVVGIHPGTQPRRAQLSCLLTTHYLEEAEALCEEIALINGGRIVAQGTIEELKWTYSAASIEEVYLKVVGRDISG